MLEKSAARFTTEATTNSVAIVGDTHLNATCHWLKKDSIVFLTPISKKAPSHAAHPNADNSIYKSSRFRMFKNYKFEKHQGALSLMIK